MATNSVGVVSQLYTTSEDRRNRLTELDLTEETLVEAVQRGLAAWAGCTRNHPALYPGIAAWAETVCAIREVQIPRGWYRSDEGNLPFTVNSSGTIALTVATGDDATGRPDEIPCTKSSKGPRTARAIEINQRQLTLFDDIRLRPQDLDELNSGRMTWMLLIHRDVLRREIRCELSRPVNMNEDGRVDGWAERIILPSTPFGADTAEMPMPEVPQSPVIDVQVTRRG